MYSCLFNKKWVELQLQQIKLSNIFRLLHRIIKLCFVMYLCFLKPLPDIWLFVPARRLLHHHGVVPVEGDGHHAGELSAPLHPQVPAKTLQPAQLLQADLLKTETSLWPHLKQKGVPVFIQLSLRFDQRIKPGFIPFNLFWKVPLGNVKGRTVMSGTECLLRGRAGVMKQRHLLHVFDAKTIWWFLSAEPELV